jgi:hypothetical protein
MREVAKNFLLIVISTLLTLAAVEASLYFALHNPKLIAALPVGQPLVKRLARYYVRHERKLIQFLPECAHYDDELVYVLREGGCTHDTIEYKVDYAVNSQGLRDDEVSLAAPAVIVLGDSHAMGWGVNREQVFDQLLEDRLGRPVLNAAISSYGTVRELIMLSRLDATAADDIVITYCDNDAIENRAFIENGYKTPTWTPERYQGFVERHARLRPYYPGRLILKMGQPGYYEMKYALGDMARAWLGLPDDKSRKIAPAVKAAIDSGTYADRCDETDLVRCVRDNRSAESFMQVLAHFQHLLVGKRVIVLEINGRNTNRPWFVNAVKVLAQQQGTPGFELLTLDMSPLLQDADYYLLDDHMQPAGHARVAGALLPLLQR